MSYDLYFGCRNGGPPPKRPDLVAFFQARAHYRIDGADAVYENSDTGVYFVFGLEELPDDEDSDPDPFPCAASFNINYFRPHVFGLEAAPELAAFVRHFDWAIDDPQNDGMGREAFSEAGFLKGWNAGNALAYHAIARQHPDESLLALPGEALEAAWRWNRGREALQQELCNRGRDVFVPKISLVAGPKGAEEAASPRTIAVWPDAIPCALPQVDLLFMPRRKLAPRGLLRRKQDVTVAAWAEAAALIEAFALAEAALPYRLLDYPAAPGEITAFVSGCAAVTQKDFRMLTNDQVLNLELLQDARVTAARAAAPARD